MRSFLLPRAPGRVLPIFLAVVAGALSAHAQTPASRLRSVEVTRTETALVVTIQADGPLPEPAVGDVDGPPRVFLDFPGVEPATRGAAGRGLAPIVRVRVALNTATPLVTRVVVDLSRPTPAQLELSERQAGRIRVLFDPESSLRPPPTPLDIPQRKSESVPAGGAPKSPVSPVPELPAAPRPPAPSGTNAPPPAPKPPATTPSANVAPPTGTAGAGSRIPPADAERYRTQVGAQLDRIRGLRALLTAIDQKEVRMPGGLTEMRSELSGMLRTLNAVRPPESVGPTHDLLVRSASLALMAITLRDVAPEAAVDHDALRNASSAAAGALLLLDRVCIEVGCGGAPGR